MKQIKVLFLLIISIFYSHGNTNRLNLENCPDLSNQNDWNNLDKEHCESPRTLHCQSDNEKNIIYSMCATAIDCNAGTYAYLDTDEEKVKCKPCTKRFYQPSGRKSNAYTQPNCDRVKVKCQDEEGYELCLEATDIQDYKCYCNYTLGYVPNYGGQKCTCFSYDNECGCSKHECTDGEEPNQEYKCVPVQTTTTTSSPTPPNMTVQTTSTTTTPDIVSDEGLTGGEIAGIVIAVLLVLIAIPALICYMKYKKKVQKIPCMKKCFPCLKKHDNTDSHVSSSPTAVTDLNGVPNASSSVSLLDIIITSESIQRTSAEAEEQPLNPTAPQPPPAEPNGVAGVRQEETGDPPANPLSHIQATTHDEGQLAIGLADSDIVWATAKTKVSEQNMKDKIATKTEPGPQPMGQQINVTAMNVNIGENPQLTAINTDAKHSSNPRDVDLVNDGGEFPSLPVYSLKTDSGPSPPSNDTDQTYVKRPFPGSDRPPVSVNMDDSGASTRSNNTDQTYVKTPTPGSVSPSVSVNMDDTEVKMPYKEQSLKHPTSNGVQA